uniref:Complexin-2 n=1 Tax=Taeniopygia guttata TaxID=59729 RepID=A0A674G875_TAEGU
MDFVMKQALGGECWGARRRRTPTRRRRRRRGRRPCASRRRSGKPSTPAWKRSGRKSGSRSYGLKKKEEKEAEEKAALEQPCEGSLTRPKKAIPAGCGDEEEEEEESILDTVLKYLPGPLQDMFKK